MGSHNEIVACPWSDHDMMLSTITVKNKNKIKNNGHWHFNTTLLRGTTFQTIIRNQWANWKILKPRDGSIVEWWDQGKLNLKRTAISYSADLNRQRRSEYKELLKDINRLQREIDLGDSTCANVLTNKQNRLKEIEKITKSTHRIKTDTTEKIHGEPQINFPPSTDNFQFKNMQSLRDRDGREITDPIEMTGECRHFYEDLYTADPVDNTEIDLLLDTVDRALDPDDVATLEGPVTLSEVKGALFDMEADKSPGSDGLPAELYKFFFSDMGQDICDVLNNAFEHNILSKSQRHGLITLIYKDRGRRDDLTNWRPISLLNVDYKIMSKILANRVKRILHQIIHVDQTCSVSGRSISDNAHLLKNIQSFVDQKQLGAVFVSLDQQKAFDRVSWEYMHRVLGKFGFGPNFQKWVQILYNDITSSVKCCGMVSDEFSLSRGVRQGCPLSPLLYILALEPLGCAIRLYKNIKGVKLPGGTEAKISMYADDTTLILSDDKSIIRSFQLVRRYEHASGAKLNRQKSYGVYLGKWRNKTSGPVNINWSESAKIVGIFFGYDDPPDKLWKENISKIKKEIHNWSNTDLTMKGRVTVAN